MNLLKRLFCAGTAQVINNYTNFTIPVLLKREYSYYGFGQTAMRWITYVDGFTDGDVFSDGSHKFYRVLADGKVERYEETSLVFANKIPSKILNADTSGRGSA